VAHRVVFRTPSADEYLALLVSVRRAFEEVLPLLLERPLRSGPGYSVAAIRGHPGLWKLKLRDFPPRAFRAVYEVDGDLVRFLGFGPRPRFYRRLEQSDRLSRSRF
jgi:hypothetical protein